MNIPKIADAIGYIDNELITATLEAPPKKRHNPVMKWMDGCGLSYPICTQEFCSSSFKE